MNSTLYFNIIVNRRLAETDFVRPRIPQRLSSFEPPGQILYTVTIHLDRLAEYKCLVFMFSQNLKVQSFQIFFLL